MSWEEDHLMAKVGELETRLAKVEAALAEYETDDAEDYSAWSATELKDELKRRDLPVDGKKADHVARLEADDAAREEG